jgi:hypothetical protein
LSGSDLSNRAHAPSLSSADQPGSGCEALLADVEIHETRTASRPMSLRSAGDALVPRTGQCLVRALGGSGLQAL